MEWITLGTFKTLDEAEALKASASSINPNVEIDIEETFYGFSVKMLTDVNRRFNDNAFFRGAR